MAAFKDKTFLEQQIAATQALVAEGEQMIDTQIRLIAEMTVLKKSTVEEDYSLEVMIKIRAAHLAFRRDLEDLLAGEA
jgi:hypothetical protein